MSKFTTQSLNHYVNTYLETKDLRDFLFRGLMFESEADAFRKAGIQIGVDATEAEENLLKEALAPFGVIRRNKALEMSSVL
jgi:hypothetical protein